MKKLILICCIFALVGCSSTQDKIDVYKEKRDAIAQKTLHTVSKVNCIKHCNETFELGADRAECKALCVID